MPVRAAGSGGGCLGPGCHGDDVPRAAALNEIATCGLDGAAGRLVGELSGGQRQRLALALTLLPGVPLYLFDEPTANLDSEALALFHRRVQVLQAQGCAVLFTSHSSGDVRALASRTVRVERGRCVSEGRPQADRDRLPERVGETPR